MKYLILLSLALSGWIAFIYSHKSFFIGQFPILSMNSMFKISNQIHHDNIQIQQTDLQSQIKQDLYNSISTGMSYDEVRSIIGWDGILIYQNDIDYAGGEIHEKIYQWNNQDIYSIDNESQRADDRNPYWSVTLQFQNDILINKASFNLEP